MTPEANRIETARWNAVVSRAPELDGDFYYAVRTTGVFCRPSCASRRPRRENVEFFDSATAAVRAGYRPCKRCRPDESRPETPSDRAMVEACRLLSENESMRTKDVARAVGLSDSYFQRVFKKQLGITPQQYRRRVLAERARGTIAQSGSVTESVYRAGYSSSSRFYEGIGKELGMSPAAAHVGGTGEQIQYAVTQCSLGWILVAWTERGVCEVSLGDDDVSLVSQLTAHFPRATLEASEAGEWADAVVEAVDMSSPTRIPLDIRGTAFQERVWQALRKIPKGETRTYAEVARSLGQPNGARAVARACATNPLAVVVPCHRVVRKDGRASGYRWGLERKDALLRRERK